MIIKRIILKNFKIFKLIDLSFEKGINLILGNNGAGKSSIIEAISFALFDIKNNKNFNQLVRVGERRAEIIIYFIDWNNNEYKVIKKFSNKRTELHRLLILSTNEMISGSEKVKSFIMKLIGIKTGNIDEIYKTIFVAFQNELTDIFVDNLRKERFNRLFDVEVYRKIFSYFLNIINQFNTGKELIEQKISLLIERLEEYKNTEIDLKVSEGEYKEVEEKLKKLKLKKKEIEDKIKKLDEKYNNYRDIKKRINDIEITLTYKKESLEDKVKRLKDIENSIKLTNLHYNDYIKYENLNKVLKELNKEDEILFNKKEIYNKYENEISKLKVEIQNHKNNISDNLKLKNKLDSKIKNKKCELKDIEKEINEIKIKLNTISKDIDNNDQELNNLLKIKEDITKFESQNLQYKKEIENINNIIFQENSLLNKLNDLENQIRLMEKSIDNISDDKAKFMNNLSKIKELKEDREKFKSGLCPILNEECFNLKQKGITPLDFFNKKINELTETNLIIKERINEKEKLLNELNKKKKEFENINVLLMDIKYKKEYKSQLKNFISKNTEKIENFYKNLKINNLMEFQNKIETLKKEKDDLLENKSILKAKLNNRIKEKEKISNDLNDLKIELNEVDTTLEKIKQSLEEKENRLKDLIEQQKKLNYSEKEYFELKNKIRNIKNEIESLKEGWTAYKINREKTGDYKIVKNSINELSEEIARQENLKESLKKSLLNLNFKEEDYEVNKTKLESQLLDITNQIESFTARAGKLNERIIYAREELKKKNKLKKDLKIEQKNLEFLNQKIELTNKFRENIKNMGFILSKEITKNISLIATEFYRKLSGNNEIIEWSSENEYLPELIFTEKNNNEIKNIKRDFNMLSGGEKVSVAIALRLALRKIFSSRAFFIMDEPTVNLDNQRKQSLSLSIRDMLSKVDQSFIITHDQIFLDVAGKIIQLNSKE